jgi:hypothetical protein
MPSPEKHGRPALLAIRCSDRGLCTRDSGSVERRWMAPGDLASRASRYGSSRERACPRPLLVVASFAIGMDRGFTTCEMQGRRVRGSCEHAAYANAPRARCTRTHHAHAARARCTRTHHAHAARARCTRTLHANASRERITRTHHASTAPIPRCRRRVSRVGPAGENHGETVERCCFARGQFVQHERGVVENENVDAGVKSALRVCEWRGRFALTKFVEQLSAVFPQGFCCR